MHPHSADVCYVLGTVRVQQHKWSEACSFFREACTLQPTIPEYHLALAEALAHTGAFAEAEEQRAKARRLTLSPR